MSPASKSKSKDKITRMEPSKGSSKPSAYVSTASGYNPHLGTFHTFDNTYDHNSPGSEDSVSNNGSWSGESEDHKEKTSQHPLPTKDNPVPGHDADKRDKIRLKNEKKHQRQKEKRAQELHEKCSGYLMSRKLEALAQQFVAMGFSQERATMALILNEGRVEESVAWILEGGEEEGDNHRRQNLDGGGNLKIDISEELARISKMEVKYKCSKQEVERAVLACEGDLETAEETLKAQKKIEETDPIRVPGGPPASSNSIQSKRDEKDFNYAKAVPVTVGPSIDHLKGVEKIPPKLERAKPQKIAAPVEKMWSSSESNPSIANELKNLQLGSLKQPVTVMKRPVVQSVNSNQTPTSSYAPSPPPVVVPPAAATRNLSSGGIQLNPMYNQFHNQPQQQYFPTSRGPSPPISAASSLGLFTGGNGLPESSSPVDWASGGSSYPFDYTNIDWSLDPGLLNSRPNALWTAPNYSVKNNANRGYDSFDYGLGANYGSTGLGVNYGTRQVRFNGSGAPIIPGVISSETSGGGGSGSREWASPFEEKELFSSPRQFVSYPTLYN